MVVVICFLCSYIKLDEAFDIILLFNEENEQRGIK